MDMAIQVGWNRFGNLTSELLENCQQELLLVDGNMDTNQFNRAGIHWNPSL